MIKIIGTAHVLEKSMKDVQTLIEREKPDIIAIELDEERFRALDEMCWDLNSSESLSFRKIFQEAVRGGSLLVLFGRFLSLIQQELGRRFGCPPGSEMVTAIKSAGNCGARIALIDRDVIITLNHLLNIPLKEKIHLFTRSSKDLEIIGSVLGANPDKIVDREIVNKILMDLRMNLPKLYSSTNAE